MNMFIRLFTWFCLLHTIKLIMTGNFELLDYLIFGLYAITILGIGLWVSRDKGGRQKSAEDFLLANHYLGGL